jgi:hypothetical protein
LEASLGYIRSARQAWANSEYCLKKKKKGWGYSSVVECLPSMHKTLGLTTSTVKKKKKRKTRN